MQLIARNLTCVRGGRTVFEDLSLAVDGGTGLLLRGPNGAGKTSLLRTLAGFLRQAGGTIALEGSDPETPLSEQCHYVGHLNGVKRALTVAENLAFWSRYLAGGGIAAGLERLRLSELADIPAGYLSAGQSRRLALARLVVAARPVWLLDEPSVSLDDASRALLADLMRGHLAGGGIIAAATHADLGAAFDQTLVLGQARAAS